jgi:hypothetical protein
MPAGRTERARPMTTTTTTTTALVGIEGPKAGPWYPTPNGLWGEVDLTCQLCGYRSIDRLRTYAIVFMWAHIQEAHPMPGTRAGLNPKGLSMAAIEGTTALVGQVVGDPEFYELDGQERASVILALRDDPSGSTVRLVAGGPGPVPVFLTKGAHIQARGQFHEVQGPAVFVVNSWGLTPTQPFPFWEVTTVPVDDPEALQQALAVAWEPYGIANGCHQLRRRSWRVITWADFSPTDLTEGM